STSVTVPSSSIASSFAIVLLCSRVGSNKKRGPPGVVQTGPAFSGSSASYDLGAELGDVLGGGTLLALHDVELDALAFGRRLEAAALNGGVMNEAILLSVLGGDETKSLGVVEPLHFSGGTHFGTSSAIGRKCRVAVPIRLLFVRDPDDRMSRQKIKRPGNTPGPCTAIWHL